MASKKQPILNGSIVSAELIGSIYGDGTNNATISGSGHQHTGGNTIGEVSKIDLAAHTSGRLVLQDAYSVARSVSSYPDVVATPNNILSGTFLNIANSQLNSSASLSIPANPTDTILINGSSATISGNLGTSGGALPTSNNITGILNGSVNISLSNPFTSTGTSTPVSPFTVPNIITSAIWYFNIPTDMDITKPAYFSFNWMGDILTTDGYGNAILDTTKLNSAGVIQSQTTTFRITWQWFVPGFAVYPPAVIYDGFNPANINGTNINTNSLTRGRIANMTVNDFPFKLIVNNSSTNNPNYVGLTGLTQATNAVMVGIQVDVLSSGYVNSAVGSQSGHLRFYNGNFIYLSKTMGSPNTAFKTF